MNASVLHHVRQVASVATRSALAALAAVLAASALLTPAVSAQAPELPSLIRIVVPFPPGGSNDLSARAIAQQLGTRLKRNVIVENRPGASGFIGAQLVAKAPRDGSTLLLTSSSLATAAATKTNAPVDIVKELEAVSILSESPLLFVVFADSPIRTPADLVAQARAKPDTITNGTPGSGTIAHLSAELINDIAKVQLKHIPYQGGGPAMIDLLGGRVDLNVVSNSATAAYVTSGKLRAIGISSAAPNAAFPGVPPIATAVPGYDVQQWQAVWVPAGTPGAIVERLNRELNEIVKTPEFGTLLRDDGGVPVSATPAAANERVRTSVEMWRKLAKSKNIVID